MIRPPRPLPLDFVGSPRQAPLAGAALLAAGVAAALALGISFQRKLAERGVLDARLGAAAKPRPTAPSADSIKLAAEALIVERELGIPWTGLLGELEAASRATANSVSLLHVEPDPGKQSVRITAEVRALPDALAYLQRLQKSAVLRYPMLESHERRKDDPQHPVLIKLSAEWRP
jgi:hypothetical protein